MKSENESIHTYGTVFSYQRYGAQTRLKPANNAALESVCSVGGNLLLFLSSHKRGMNFDKSEEVEEVLNQGCEINNKENSEWSQFKQNEFVIHIWVLISRFDSFINLLLRGISMKIYTMCNLTSVDHKELNVCKFRIFLIIHSNNRILFERFVMNDIICSPVIILTVTLLSENTKPTSQI